MITSYQIRKLSPNEECLILYITMQEEFSIEWFDKLKEEGFYDFIRKHHLLWNGTKVFLIIGGITLAVLNYDPAISKNDTYTYVSDSLFPSVASEIIVSPDVEEENIEQEIAIPLEKEQVEIENSNNENVTILDSSPNISDSATSTPSQEYNSSIPMVTPDLSNKDEIIESPPVTEISPEVDSSLVVTVYRSTGNIISLSLEDYLIGVVAAEMPASFQIDALKAQSILARTYTMKALDTGKTLTDTVSTQRYIDTNQMQSLWGSSYSTYYNKIKKAVLETKDLVVTYQGTLIEAVYHSTSNGATEDSEYVWGNSFSYLKSVPSLWDKTVSTYSSHQEISRQEFCTIFELDDETYSVEILERNRSGRVSYVRIGNKTYTGVEVRTRLGLRSTDFDLYLDDAGIKIDTRGYGHGVGMSQYGANGMAKEGSSFRDIIYHYYTGVEIVSMI